MISRPVKHVYDDIEVIVGEIKEFFNDVGDEVNTTTTYFETFKEKLLDSLQFLKDDFDTVAEMVVNRDNELINMAFEIKELKESIQEYQLTIDEMGQDNSFEHF